MPLLFGKKHLFSIPQLKAFHVSHGESQPETFCMQRSFKLFLTSFQVPESFFAKL